MIQPITHRTPNFIICLAAAFFLSACGLGPAAAKLEVLWSGRPGPSLLTRPDKVIVTTEATSISRELPLRQRPSDVYLLAVPEGDLAAVAERIVLRNTSTGELLEPDFVDDKAQREVLKQTIDRRIVLQPFGYFRGVRAARLAIDAERPIPFGNSSYEIASYTIRVTYPQIAAVAGGNDSAMKAGALYRDMLDKAFVNAPALDRFITPMGADPLAGPVAWQPRPELSPEFPWLKVPISEDGLYVIDGHWLSDAGLDPTALDPQSLYLVNAGEIVPLEVAGPSGSGFQGGERVLFYGLGNPSAETLVNTYYLGRRPAGVIPPAFHRGPAFDSSLPLLSTFVRTRVTERDNERETSFGAFLSIRNMVWVWSRLKFDEAVPVEFDMPGIVLDDPARPTTFTVQLHIPSVEHVRDADVEVERGGTTLLRRQLDPRVKDYVFGLPAGELEGSGNELAVRLVPHAGDKKPELPDVFLDSLAAVYTSQFALEDGLLDIRFTDPLTVPKGRHLLHLAGPRSRQLLAFDLTDPGAPQLLASQPVDDALCVCADVALDSRILLVERDRIPRAPSPEASHWIDWTIDDHSADVLIVYHPVFEEAARELADLLTDAGYETLPVDVLSVYESFSDGNLSTDAIRAFLSNAVHNWTGRRPQAAILIGDSTSDGRNLSHDDLPNYMPIPLTASSSGDESHAFSTDSIYTWLTEGDEAADIIVSRLSSAEPEEALAFAANNADYRKTNSQPAPWTNRLLAVSDTGEFHRSLDETVRDSLGTSYVYTLLAADDFAWEDNYYLPDYLITREEDSKVSPLLTSAIEEGINAGAAVVTFFGHGAPNLWSNQRFWFGGGTPNSDIIRLRNSGMLPLVTSFTCNNAVVDYPLKPWNICIAEDFMRHKGTGAIGAFMPSGPGYLTNHKIVARGFLRSWSQLGVRKMGVLAELARLYHQMINPGDIHSRMFLFLGDPTLELPPPPEGVNEPHADPAVLASDGDVLIDEMTRVSDDTAPHGTAAWRLVLGNRTPLHREAILHASLLDGNGQTIEKQERPIGLGPDESTALTIAFKMPPPGAWRVVFELPAEHGKWFVDRLPSRRATDYFAIGDESAEARIVIAPDSFKLLDAGSSNQDPSIRFQAANLGKIAVSGTVEGRLSFTDSQDSMSFQSPNAMIQPGKSTLISSRFIAGREWKSAARFDVELSCKPDGTDEATTATVQWTIDPSALPDLAVDRKSITLFPLPLSDGLTIFVDATIENRGGGNSPECRAALFAGDDIGRKKPLRNITGDDYAVIPPLLPGERHPVRIRWDPSKNAGEYDIHLVADSAGGMIEPDKENNVAVIPLKVRSKSLLKPGDLLVGKGEKPGQLILVGKVANNGGTDARRVTVNFYKSPEQTPENKIGEVLLDRVPAGETLDAPFLWQIDLEHEDVSQLKPTFTVALKGSLMRISSVAEDPEDDASKSQE